MFDVFLNDLLHGQGVLSVCVDNLASPHFTLLTSDSTLSPGDMNLLKLLYASNGDVVKTLVSPDDQPPRPPRLSVENTFQALKPMADPNGDPPRPPRLAVENTFQAPKVMTSPDDYPPRPPR